MLHQMGGQEVAAHGDTGLQQEKQRHSEREIQGGGFHGRIGDQQQGGQIHNHGGHDAQNHIHAVGNADNCQNFMLFGRV